MSDLTNRAAALAALIAEQQDEYLAGARRRDPAIAEAWAQMVPVQASEVGRRRLTTAIMRACEMVDYDPRSRFSEFAALVWRELNAPHPWNRQS